VSVSPTSVSVLLGEPQTFTATVTDSTGNLANTAVSWTVNGIAGGNATAGTISAGGIYTAPANLPASGPVTVQATSAADTSKSAAGTVNILSDISVSVSPQAMPIELGAQYPFTATVGSAGNPNRSVTWIVSGNGCAGTACGVVDVYGNYTAPQILTAPPGVSLTAISVADTSKSATGTITVTSSFALSLTGPASINAGASANYTAMLTPVANSNPSRTISWSVSGPGCTGAACGTVSSSGVYTAPLLPPSPATVQVTATPLADSSKSASIAVSIVSTVAVSISPAASTVALGATQAFQATVTGTQNPTVTWEVNGIAGGNSTLGTILNSQITPNSTTYTAPQSLPAGPVTVEALSNANPSVSASAAITFTTIVSVSLTPPSATLAISHRQTFSVQVNNTPNQSVAWLVNGVAGGNSAVGQICLTGSTPCQQLTSSNGVSVDYMAPAGVPSPNPVTVTATSIDSAVSSSSNIAILPHVVVRVLPGNAAVAGGGQQGFSATVTGTGNQQVTWSISGAGCGIAGACGSIDSTGLYVAPPSPPSPNLIDVVATSADDTAQSGTATATITTSAAPVISSIAPSSAYVGSSGGFTLLVSGNEFIASNPGPGSTISIAGSPHTTACTSNSQCTAALTAGDLQSAGNLSVQVQNPYGTLSAPFTFVVLVPGSGATMIALTPSAPSSTGNDLIVVELSTNGGSGASGNVSLNVAAIGTYNVATSSCTLDASTVAIVRPASGTGTADLCVFSVSGLDPSFTYTLTGPSAPDITIIGLDPLGLGILHIELLVPATAATGPRTLFVENPEKDEAAASGAIEVR
jgi:hypothetical protein